jgi:hypothetical protein
MPRHPITLRLVLLVHFHQVLNSNTLEERVIKYGELGIQDSGSFRLDRVIFSAEINACTIQSAVQMYENASSSDHTKTCLLDKIPMPLPAPIHSS